MTPQSQFQSADSQQGSPLASLMGDNGMAQAGGAPNAQQQAEGVKDTLKGIMAAAVSVAASVPSLGDKMKEIRQSAMEGILVVQNMAAGSGSDSGGY